MECFDENCLKLGGKEVRFPSEDEVQVFYEMLEVNQNGLKALTWNQNANSSFISRDIKNNRGRLSRLLTFRNRRQSARDSPPAASPCLLGRRLQPQLHRGVVASDHRRRVPLQSQRHGKLYRTHLEG